MRVLGIDPGLRLTGYGCVEDAADGSASIIEAGVVRLVRGREVPTVSSRLAELHADVAEMIVRLEPEVVAVEGLFAHYKHPATSVVMGHARGVILLAAENAGVTLVELKPALVKKSIAASGRASKRQVQLAVQDTFGLPEMPEPPDVADALAIGLCALRRRSGAPIELA